MPQRRALPDDELRERLRGYLRVLGLTLTLAELDDRLAWVSRENPGATEMLVHVLGIEAAHKLERRIERRIDSSGLLETKTLQAFDFAFQPGLEKSFILELARLDFVRRRA